MLTAWDRPALADAARPLSRLAFASLVVLSPFRARIELAARPTPPVYGDYTDFVVLWSEVALLAVLALWLISLARGRRVPTMGPRFLAVPVGGLLAVAALGIPVAVDPALAAWNVLHLALFVALALYVVNELDLADLAVPIGIMVVIQAVVAIGQAVAQRSLGLDGLGEHTLSPILGVSVVTAADGARLLRAYGLADHPNILGGILVFALLLLPIARRAGDRLGFPANVFAVGAVTLFVTFSRAAALGLVVGLAVLAGILVARGDRPGARRWIGALILAGVACAPFVLADAPFVGARTDASGSIATEARSITERAALAAEASLLFIDHPLLGVGLGDLPLAMHAADPSFPYPYQPAHLVLLDVAAETGVLGGLLYLAILVSPWLAMVRSRERWTTDLAAASAALAAVTVVGFFDYYTWTFPAGRIWGWLVLGMWAVAYRRARVAVGLKPLAHQVAISA